jgi:hypothetical protein
MKGDELKAMLLFSMDFVGFDRFTRWLGSLGELDVTDLASYEYMLNT